jgi:hypothetical protein
MITAPMRTSPVEFAAAMIVSVPSPCPVAGETCSQGDALLAVHTQSRLAAALTVTRPPSAASGCDGGLALTLHTVSVGPVNCVTEVPLHAAAAAAQHKATALSAEYGRATRRAGAYARPTAHSQEEGDRRKETGGRSQEEERVCRRRGRPGFYLLSPIS